MPACAGSAAGHETLGGEVSRAYDNRFHCVDPRFTTVDEESKCNDRYPDVCTTIFFWQSCEDGPLKCLDSSDDQYSAIAEQCPVQCGGRADNEKPPGYYACKDASVCYWSDEFAASAISYISSNVQCDTEVAGKFV